MFADLSLDEIMPIGRYKGEEIAQLYKSKPRYIRWLVTQDFIKNDYPELHRTLKTIIELEKLYGEIGLLR